MSSTVSYIVSVILAVCFHAAVVGLLLMNWDDNELVNVLSEQRYYIEATVVDENPYKAIKRKEEANEAEKRRIARRNAAKKKHAWTGKPLKKPNDGTWRNNSQRKERKRSRTPSPGPRQI